VSHQLDARLAVYARAVDAAAAHLLSSEPLYQGLYDMLRYHLGWTEDPSAPPAGSAGKKLRPGLCLLVAETVQGDWRPALPAATAVELLHNFSLIHDDIEDRSPLRRHRTTVWARWGAAHGINAGDALLIAAEQALLEADPPPAAEVSLGALQLLNRTCRALCEGQYLDLLWEERPAVAVAQYLEMIERKTAGLFQCAAELGASCADAGPEVQRHCSSYGRAIGMAFQIADDLLGVWGPEAETGKTADLDVANRKKTLPILLGLCAPESADSQRLRILFAAEGRLTPAQTAEATDLLSRLGSRSQTLEVACRYRDEALNELDSLAARCDVSALREFTQEMLPHSKD
jgi:geranylgeranyl diphosphate synthase type I